MDREGVHHCISVRRVVEPEHRLYYILHIFLENNHNNIRSIMEKTQQFILICHKSSVKYQIVVILNQTHIVREITP